jgi:hypothetical protein
MAKRRPERKKPARKGDEQLSLPTARAAPAETRVLPMQLKVGDRLADERGEWQVIGRPYTTAGGKDAHIRLELVAQPGVTEIRSWGAHERVAVKRA